MSAAVRTFVIVLATFSCAASAATVYVSTAGNDASDGLSWPNAKRTVQAGLNTAQSGDQVWVAAGTYVQCITLRAGVALYGGFAGTETHLGQRVWTANVTTLDGNSIGSVVTVPAGAGATTRIDGLTIRNGSGTLRGYQRYGGGIYCSGSSPTILNNTITANAGFIGGGIACMDSSSPSISNNTITGNTTYYGSGISCSSSSSPAITGNAITDNSADDYYEAYGGGIYCDASSPTITGNTIARNHASSMEWPSGGGGIYCNASSPTIANNMIVDNTADQGGGVMCTFSSSPTISNNTIIDNIAAFRGGGIHSVRSTPTITGNTVCGNSASGDGGGVHCEDLRAIIVNNTIVANGADNGGGVYCGNNSPVIANSIIAFNSSGVHYYSDYGGTTAILSSNCVYGNAAYDYSGLANPTGANGNISADPRLPSTAYGKLHLQLDSPCINAGDNTAVQAGWPDVDGQPRIIGASVDIGADESDGSAWPTTSGIIVRVCPDGDDANNGSSWALAKRTVQAGISAAASPQGQVWVARGTYVENIALAREVAVYGGFAGTETDLSQRNWAANVTVLDGNQKGSVVMAPIGATATTRIDGFVIRNGNGTSNLFDAGPCGGGVYCRYSSLTIANNTIVSNSGYHGEAIYCSSASPAITNNTITGNGGDAEYGAIYCESGFPTITHNTIVGNSGGIYCSNSSPAIANTILAFNSSGIYSNASTPSLRHNCIYGNIAFDYFGLSDATGTNGNIAADPKLAAIPYGNVHIQPASLCIDAGDDSLVQAGSQDMDGQKRILGSHVDIGADESDGTTWLADPSVIVCVAPEGNDANDGSSWPLAKRTVQAAVEAAADSGGEVWVKAGIYVEPIILRNFVHVYGGFAGSETARSARDWARNVVILDGGQCENVVAAQSLGTVSTLDGFVIRNATSGIYCDKSSPTITNSTISGNSHGVYCDHFSCPIIADNRIVDNLANGILCRGSSFPRIIRNTISGSNWANGCGIYCYDSSPMIAGNTIWGNSGLSGIYVADSSPMIICNTIAGNKSRWQGGGIRCYWSTATITGNMIVGNSASYGGGICCEGGEEMPTIAMNTIVGNSATEGGGIYCWGAAAISHTLVAFNSSGIFVKRGYTPVLRYDCVYGNTAYNFSGLADPTGSNGNLSADPRLVRPASPGSDGIWGTTDDDYGDLHLTAGSPCINTADPTCMPAANETDFDGQPRVLYGRLDIGADEYQVAGDCNFDGFVNIGDLQVLVSGWGSSASAGGSYRIGADLNGDGFVNVGDLQLLVANWSRSLN